VDILETYVICKSYLIGWVLYSN